MFAVDHGFRRRLGVREVSISMVAMTEQLGVYGQEEMILQARELSLHSV